MVSGFAFVYLQFNVIYTRFCVYYDTIQKTSQHLRHLAVGRNLSRPKKYNDTEARSIEAEFNQPRRCFLSLCDFLHAIPSLH